MERYHRQILRIGEQGQRRLAHAKLLVIGAGGSGCSALPYLAGAGIGTLGVIDHDRIAISNLHRQVLFTLADVGHIKAEAAKTHLHALNPDIIIHAYAEELTAENAVGLFAAYDLIIDGTDSFAAKYLINDTAVKLGKPWIYGAMEDDEARAALFDATQGACYRCLKPQAADRHCADAGILGPVAGIAGTAQAMEAIRLLLGQPSLSGRLWVMDTSSMKSHVSVIAKRADCPTCSKAPADIVPEYVSPACAITEVQEIAWDMVGSALLIDVREREEWDEGHIPNARHLPLSALQKNPECFAPYAGSRTVLYCQRGRRSEKAAGILLRAGFADIYSLAGGIDAWREKATSSSGSG